MTTTVALHWSTALSNRGACSEAVRYAETHESFSAAWAACERGDWMLWILGKLSGQRDSDSRRKLVLIATECAELTLPLYENRYPNDSRVRDCIAACKRYAAGEISMTELRKYRVGASDAAYDAAYAAYDAAYAASATASAAYAAAYAAYAASDDASDAAYDAASDAAKKKTLAQCAAIVRTHYPNPPEL